MRRPLFTADSASVTVLRSLASSAFGKYDLTIPEGMDPEDFYEFAAPDNELAYVASLVSARRVGGLARRFVRADVQVTAKDDTDSDWVASSTVDDVLEEAAERTSGDFFLESDISKAGLNGYEPFVDFTVGDKADVDVWGRYVTLPVTRIQPGVSEHDTSDFLVHLGGQIVSDTDARLAENEEIRRALIEDRRDLAGLEAQVSKAVAAATDAQSTASKAKSTADTAQSTADSAVVKADAAQAVADVKSRNFYGAATPVGARAGDSWFRQAADGTFTVWQFRPGTDGVLRWVEAVPKVDLSGVQADLSRVKLDLDAAELELSRISPDLAAVEAAQSEAQVALEKAQADVASAQQSVDALKVTVADLPTDADVAAAVAGKVDGAVYTQKMQQLDSDLSAAKGNISTLHSSLSTLDGKLAAANSEIAKKVNSSDYQAKMIQLDSDLSAARAEALRAGLLTPGNLVWNPKFKDSGHGWNRNAVQMQYFATGGYKDAFARATWTVADNTYRACIYNGYPNHAKMTPTAAGRTLKLTVWLRPSQVIPAGALKLWAFKGTVTVSPELPANVWTKWEATSKITAEPTAYKGTWFTLGATPSMPLGIPVDISEPSMVEAADNWLIIDGAVSATKIAANAVEAQHVAAGAITAGKIGAGAVTASELAAGAVTAGKIAANAITANEIATNAVTADELAANAVTANHLTAGAVVAGKIAADAVVASNIAAGAVTAGKIAAGAITAREIQSGTITGAEIKAGSVTSDKLLVSNGFINNAMIADAAITSAKIGDLAVNSAKIADGSILTAKIADGSILTAKIGDAQIVSAKIADAAISTAKIQDAAITNAKIANLDAGKITTGTLDAGRIGAGAITADKIAVDSLSAREIKAEVFTQVGSNLLPLEPGTVNGAWTANRRATGTDDTVYQGFRWYSFDKTYAAKYTNMTQVDPSLEYDFTVWLKGDNNSKLYVELRDQDGKHAVASGGLNNINPAGAQGASAYLVAGMTLPTAWTKYTTRIRLHPGVRAVRVGAISGSHSSGPAGVAYIGDMTLTRHQVPQAEIDALQDAAIRARPLLDGGAWPEWRGGKNYCDGRIGVVTTDLERGVIITAHDSWTGMLIVHFQNRDGFNNEAGAQFMPIRVTASNRGPWRYTPANATHGVDAVAFHIVLD